MACISFLQLTSEATTQCPWGPRAEMKNMFNCEDISHCTSGSTCPDENVKKRKGKRCRQNEEGWRWMKRGTTQKRFDKRRRGLDKCFHFCCILNDNKAHLPLHEIYLTGRLTSYTLHNLRVCLDYLKCSREFPS